MLNAFWNAFWKVKKLLFQHMHTQMCGAVTLRIKKHINIKKSKGLYLNKLKRPPTNV